MAFVTGRKARLRSASDAPGTTPVVEEMKAHFNAEVPALRSELREAYALLEKLRTLNAFARYERSETDTVN